MPVRDPAPANRQNSSVLRKAAFSIDEIRLKARIAKLAVDPGQCLSWRCSLPCEESRTHRQDLTCGVDNRRTDGAGERLYPALVVMWNTMAVSYCLPGGISPLLPVLILLFLLSSIPLVPLISSTSCGTATPLLSRLFSFRDSSAAHNSVLEDMDPVDSP